MIVVQLNNLSTNVLNIRKLLVAQNEKLEACIQTVDCLENITDKLGELENKIRFGDQEIFEEVRMRIERERNILIFRIDETPDANSVVKCIINNITPPATTRIEEISKVETEYPTSPHKS
ncbi:hypothetical protein JTB14_005570 [Gonioctena quinquepunctata]|nr:hypothetical protein JTB14_005570 [Gonioctena quinquepunctata]